MTRNNFPTNELSPVPAYNKCLNRNFLFQGTPLGMRCVALDPQDFRGQPIYRIEFDIETPNNGKEEGMIHR